MESEVIPRLGLGAVEDTIKALTLAGWSSQIIRPYFSNQLGTSTILKVNNLGKRFGEFSVFEGLNIEVRKGDILAITGPSASGKTTLLNILCCLAMPTYGRVEINENSRLVPLNPRYVRSMIGYSTQRPSFYPDLTVAQNIRHYLGLYGRSAEQEHLLNKSGLKDYANVPAGNLSAGTQRKLDIALAIAHHPEIILLDEPFSELDAQSKAGLWDLLYELNSAETTIIITSKSEDDVKGYCTRTIKLNPMNLLT